MKQGNNYFPPSKKAYRNTIAPKITARALALRSFMNVAYMADILNLANCANPDSVFNTGIPLCDLKRKFFRSRYSQRCCVYCCR
jgi:hypothetical protein